MARLLILAGLAALGWILFRWFVVRMHAASRPALDEPRALGPAAPVAPVPSLDAPERPGLHPAHPIYVESPVLVETIASELSCVRCGAGELDIEEHDALVHDGAVLRVVPVVCASCGSKRAVYFQVESAQVVH